MLERGSTWGTPLVPARIALLDDTFAERVKPWPRISPARLNRACARPPPTWTSSARSPRSLASRSGSRCSSGTSPPAGATSSREGSASLDLAVREYGPAPIADALRVAAQLAGALDFAAAVQITHGALHPRDVLLSSDDTRLTGVGVTRALHRIGVVAPVRRPYTAPERIAGAEWDRRADVFSLAALMHELIWARRVSGLGSRAADNLTDIEGARLPH